MRIVRVGCGAALAAIAASALAISEPPVPIWPADGRIPDSLKNQYVFLTPDLGTMVIVFPPEEGASERKILPFTIHNRIHAAASVTRRGGSFAYNYSVWNSKTSQDDISTVGVVIPRDEPSQVGAEAGKIGVIHGDIQRVGLTGAPNGWEVLWFCPDDHPLGLARLPTLSLSLATDRASRRPPRLAIPQLKYPRSGLKRSSSRRP